MMMRPTRSSTTRPAPRAGTSRQRAWADRLLAAPQPERSPHRVLELLHRRPRVRRPQLGEARVPCPALRLPFGCKTTRVDVVQQLAHPGQHVDVVEAAASRELAVLAGGRVEVE